MPKDFFVPYLNKDIIIVVFSRIDEDSKQGENWILDEEQALGPHDHKGDDGQEDPTNPHHPGVHPTPPVPLWNRLPLTDMSLLCYMLQFVDICSHSETCYNS